MICSDTHELLMNFSVIDYNSVIVILEYLLWIRLEYLICVQISCDAFLYRYSHISYYKIFPICCHIYKSGYISATTVESWFTKYFTAIFPKQTEQNTRHIQQSDYIP